MSAEKVGKSQGIGYSGGSLDTIIGLVEYSSLEWNIECQFYGFTELCYGFTELRYGFRDGVYSFAETESTD